MKILFYFIQVKYYALKFHNLIDHLTTCVVQYMTTPHILQYMFNISDIHY